jgi:hypothetical protein
MQLSFDASHHLNTKNKEQDFVEHNREQFRNVLFSELLELLALKLGSLKEIISKIELK